MLEIEELIASSLPFWEMIVDVSGVIAGLAAVAAIVIDVPVFPLSAVARSRIKFTLAFVLIAGVTGQITATKRIMAITGEIIAFLNDRAQAANKLAGEANLLARQADERAGIANKLAGEANERAGKAYQSAADANVRAGELNERAGKADERAADLELKAENLRTDNIKLTAALNKLGIQVGDRGMNDDERAKLKRALNGSKYSITVVMIDDREARQYAVAIFEALQRAGVSVRKELIPSTSEIGVIVCDKTKRDVNLVRHLRTAGIITKLSGKRPNRPAVCDHPIAPVAQVSSGLIGGAMDALFGTTTSEEPRGTVILVGQKRPLSIP